MFVTNSEFTFPRKLTLNLRLSRKAKSTTRLQSNLGFDRR